MKDLYREALEFVSNPPAADAPLADTAASAAAGEFDAIADPADVPLAVLVDFSEIVEAFRARFKQLAAERKQKTAQQEKRAEAASRALMLVPAPIHVTAGDHNLPSLCDFAATDAGNAERLVAHYGEDLRYCYPEKEWYTYASTHWSTDQRGRLMNLSKRIARDLLAEALKLPEGDKRTGYILWALRSESTKSRTAALAAAQSEPGIPVLPEEFDTDPFLFTCANGTINLHGGKLLPHRKEDLITKISRAHYDPEARSPLWERFLQETTGGNKEQIDFLQRAVGYSMTGDTSEEVLFFVQGPGGSGKSTFLEAIKTVFGDYARTADFQTFVQRTQTGGVREDVAELAGRRLVVSIEVDKGQKLAEGLTKTLTGGDTISSRFLYQKRFEFIPQFKLWLAANDQLQVRHDDDAIWRRILRVPFPNKIPKGQRDKTLKRRLRNVKECGPAILAWAVEGCLRWQEEGLSVPTLVEDATEEYREAMDPLRDFLQGCCVLHPNAWISNEELRRAYEQDCRERGNKYPVGVNEFAEGLKARGCGQKRRHSGRGWQGIGLVAEDSVQ